MSNKKKPKAAPPAPAPAAAPQPVHNLTSLVRRKGQPVAPPAAVVKREASPKRPAAPPKRYRTHHPAPKDCMVQVSFMARKNQVSFMARKKGCKKE